MKKQITTALFAAALCGSLLVGCGSGSSTADIGAEHSATSKTDSVADITKPADSQQDDLAEDGHYTAYNSGDDRDDNSSEGLIDRAESAVDSVGDAITGVLTDATREIHPLD